MVPVSFSDVFALDSWEGEGKLIPAEFSSIEFDQLYEFFIFFRGPVALCRLQIKLFMFEYYALFSIV